MKPTQPPAADEAEHCYRCGAVVEEGMRNCPQCGRRQTRLCYCGQEIPVTASTCPHCGADWSTAFRVRRKSKSRDFSWKVTAAYASIGALAAILLSAMVNSAVGALALHSLPSDATGLPAGFIVRLGLAMATIGRGLSDLIYHIENMGGGPLTALLLVVGGASLGAVIYLYRSGALRVRVAIPFTSARKRRRRAGDH